jgi:hypothetical protein
MLTFPEGSVARRQREGALAGIDASQGALKPDRRQLLHPCLNWALKWYPCSIVRILPADPEKIAKETEEVIGIDAT